MVHNADIAILVVDDEEFIRRMVMRILAEKGYMCAQAADGSKALEALAAREFALVISDVNMPGMSGLEMLATVRQLHPDTAIIMLTGVDNQETAIRALELGAYGYLIKPFQPNELVINVANALRRRDLEKLRDEYAQRLEREVAEYTDEIRQRETQLRTLVIELSMSEEQERRRIATALHDQISQVLAFAKIELRALMTDQAPSAARDRLERTWSYIDQAYQQTKTLTFEVSPPILYDLGLEAALDWLAEQYQTQHGLHIQLLRDGDTVPLTEKIALILFRAVQELLTNVVKHAHAHQVTIHLVYLDTAMQISVTDDGVGYIETMRTVAGTKKPKTFGHFNLRERINYLGGRFDLTSQPHQGTQVTIEVPFASRDDE